ncbi:E3 ubiquitin-protein ligase Topors-like isoform X2 [Dendronephthya gigantea]|uniref:E3 ubiquitin-protein ligase Topors-like isoform X2 n=1 Tax=Dendronephthya gigantea TaxID=151771 RepID=UPI00106AACE2|nr:E3 ubiquitin-protein ligase Topors-like isoform X2 [Dendronephthya gigantea]
MEDCDWSDLPSIKYSYNTDSSPPDDNEKNTNLVLMGQHEDENYSSDNKEENEPERAAPQTQEKESCPICLSSFEDRSFLDQCFHAFCFSCILQWCEVAQTCPLCKTGFASVIHNVKSMQDYEQYIVEKKKGNQQTCNESNETSNESFQSYDEHGFNEHGERFRYRTTRSLRSNSGNGNARFRAQNSERRVRAREARARLRRRSRSRQSTTRIRGIEKRRQVYAFKLRATSTGVRRSREISCQFFKTYQGCTHRLIPWLARDLRVLLGDNEKEVNFLVEFILSLITRIDMDSPLLVEELKPFLLETTDHFVHELLSFAKAPFDIVAYDDFVVYPWPEEGSRAENPHGRDNVNEVNELDSSGRTAPQSSSFSRCPWNDTPAGEQQSARVCDSPMQSGESPWRVVGPEVIVITDSTESPDRISKERRNPTPEHSQDNERYILQSKSFGLGHSSQEDQVSTTHEILCKTRAVRGDSGAFREELPTQKMNKESKDFVHRHIHKHKHKHRHEHKHRRRKTNSNLKAYPEHTSSATKTRAACSETVRKVHSPKLEDMQKEVEELNVLIQEHEEKLSNLEREEQKDD